MFGWIGFLVGVLFILIGGFLVIFFPGAEEHQPPPFNVVGVVLGLILLVLGGIFVFLP